MPRKNMPAGPGRPKGSQNKINAEIKDMIRTALDSLGGIEYLIKQGKENPTSFNSLIAKVIPTDLNAKLTGAVKVDGTIKFIKPDNQV